MNATPPPRTRPGPNLGQRKVYCKPFPTRLAQAIACRGLPRRYIAKTLGCDPGLVTHWTNGRSEPTLQMLVDLATILRTTPHYLLGWPERKVAVDGQ